MDQSSFTPLVFSVQGQMATEAKVFYGRLGEQLAKRRNVEKGTIMSWLRTVINFSQQRSMLLLLRGSRSIRFCDLNLIDVSVAEASRKI